MPTGRGGGGFRPRFNRLPSLLIHRLKKSSLNDSQLNAATAAGATSSIHQKNRPIDHHHRHGIENKEKERDISLIDRPERKSSPPVIVSTSDHRSKSRSSVHSTRTIPAVTPAPHPSRRFLYLYARLITSSSCYIAGLMLYDAIYKSVAQTPEGVQLMGGASFDQLSMQSEYLSFGLLLAFQSLGGSSSASTLDSLSFPDSNFATSNFTDDDSSANSGLVIYWSYTRWIISVLLIIILMAVVYLIVRASESHFSYLIQKEKLLMQGASMRKGSMETSPLSSPLSSPVTSPIDSAELEKNKISPTQNDNGNNNNNSIDSNDSNNGDRIKISITAINDPSNHTNTSRVIIQPIPSLPGADFKFDQISNSDQHSSSTSKYLIPPRSVPLSLPAVEEKSSLATSESVPPPRPWSAQEHREYLKEYREARRKVWKVNPLIMYRLADLISYYLVFVSVYAFLLGLQSQLLSPRSRPLLYWLYAFSLTATSVGICFLLQKRHADFVERLIKAPNQHEHEKIRIKQGVWRKLASYITSSLSYLVAYGIWSAVQRTLQHFLSGRARHRLFLQWSGCVLTLVVGALILVLMNVRIHGELISETGPSTPNPSSHSHHSSVENLSMLRLQRDASSGDITFSISPAGFCRVLRYFLCCGWAKRSEKLSTERLHIRVDVLEGGVLRTAPLMALWTEAMSYIVALAIGGALAASMPDIAPADVETYTGQPTCHGLFLFALLSTAIVALMTFILESSLRSLARRHIQETKQALNMVSNNSAKDLSALLFPIPSPPLIQTTINDNEKQKESDNAAAVNVNNKSQDDDYKLVTTPLKRSKTSAACDYSLTPGPPSIRSIQQSTDSMNFPLLFQSFQRNAAVVETIPHTLSSPSRSIDANDVTSNDTEKGAEGADSSQMEGEGNVKIVDNRSLRRHSLIVGGRFESPDLIAKKGLSQRGAQKGRGGGGKGRGMFRQRAFSVVDANSASNLTKNKNDEKKSQSFGNPPPSKSSKDGIETNKSSNSIVLASINATASANTSTTNSPFSSTRNSNPNGTPIHNQSTNYYGALTSDDGARNASVVLSESITDEALNDSSVEGEEEEDDYLEDIAESEFGWEDEDDDELDEKLIREEIAELELQAKQYQEEKKLKTIPPIPYPHAINEYERDRALNIAPPTDVVIRFSQTTSSSTVNENTPLLPSPTDRSSISSMTSSERLHRKLLIHTFIQEWYVALLETMIQGSSLLVAYGWVGLLEFCSFPALASSTGLDERLSQQSLYWLYAVVAFFWYFFIIICFAKLFHKDEQIFDD